MWTSLKNFPDDRNSQCLFDSLTYLAILWVFLSVFKHLIFLAITRRNSSMSMPPLLCAEGILKQIHKHFSFEFQCPVWCGEGILKHTHTHTHARKHISFDFATHHLLVNVHLKYKLLHLKSEMMVDNFISSSYQLIYREEDLKLDIIIIIVAIF